MRRRLVLLATAAAVLTTVVLGSAGQAGAVPIRETAPTAGLSRMVIVAFTYLPDPVVVKPGARVTVTNLDDAVIHLIPGHSVTADSGAFNTGIFFGTKTFTAPSKPGVYRFHCEVHFFMHGVLVVR